MEKSEYALLEQTELTCPSPVISGKVQRLVYSYFNTLFRHETNFVAACKLFLEKLINVVSSLLPTSS